jgi:DNA-binding protein HU-beta
VGFTPRKEGVVNKGELIDQLAASADLSKAEAGRVVDALFDVERGIIASTLKRGDKVQITGFGNFEARKRAARKGRNPRTGETINIAASINPAFRPGKGLKDSIKS